MIDWWRLAFNATWILGASITVATSSYLLWLARESDGGLRQALQRPAFRAYYAIAFVLIGIGWTAAATTVDRSGDAGAVSDARLQFPRGLAVDAAGSVYIADTTHNRVRKVEPNGVATTIAGNGRWGYSGDGGPATDASLYGPWGLAVDDTGTLYIADYVNDRVRKVDAATRVITTVAGGGDERGDGVPATRARLNGPYAVALDGAGNLFVADADAQRVRRVAATTGVITTIVVGGDDGLGDEARQLDVATGVTVDSAGNLYVADHWRHRIRRVSTATDETTLVAGSGPVGKGSGGSTGDGGPALQARLNDPASVSVDRSGNLYIVDAGNERIRRVSASGIITTVMGLTRETGDGGPAINAALPASAGVAVDSAGNLYVLDVINHRVRKVSHATGVITTVAQ